MEESTISVAQSRVPLAQRYKEIKQMMQQRRLRQDLKLPRFMAQTKGSIPSGTSRFFLENHTENEQVIDDLNQIEDFVDELAGNKKVKLVSQR